MENVHRSVGGNSYRWQSCHKKGVKSFDSISSIDTSNKKMQILKVNRRLSQIIGICSLPDGSDIRARIGQIFGIILVFAGLSAYGGLSVLYVVEHLRMGDIENTIFALIQVIGVLSTFASVISLLARKKSARNFFDTLQDIFDQCWYWCKLD